MTDWEEQDLIDLGKIVTGKTPPSSGRAFYGGSIPFVTPSDMDGRRTIERTARTLSSAGALKVRSSFVEQPAVCVSCIGSDMGKAVLIDQPFVSNQQINSVIVNDGVERLFVYYNLAGRKDEIRFKASGAAQPIMNKTDFGRLKLSVPNRLTQKSIAFVLSSLDDKIELNRQMNEPLEEMARSLFRDWFVDFGPTRRQMEGATDPFAIMGGAFPAEKAAKLAPLFPAALGEDRLPEGWVMKPVGELCDVVGGGTPATKNEEFWTDGSHLWATPKDLSKLAGVYVSDTERKLTDAGLARVSSGLSPAGSVLMSSRAPIGYLAIAAAPIAVNQGFIVMRPSAEFPTHFAKLWCEEKMAIIEANANGSTFQEISKKNFKPIQAISPEAVVLENFESLAGSLYSLLMSNEEENATLAALRDLLLPNLMSGEVRLCDAEASI